ncbi:MAG: RNA-binding protein [Chloroflexi bacterium]|nr:RNA-binding protein [Chloroflexota bacterium]
MRMYVGNLSYNTQSADLEKTFAAYGAVESAVVVMDRETNRSKGFGFVDMPDDAQARSAMAGLNEKELDGRILTVIEARPREARPRTEYPPRTDYQPRTSYPPRNDGPPRSSYQPRNDRPPSEDYQKGNVPQKGNAHQKGRDYQKRRDRKTDDSRDW